VKIRNFHKGLQRLYEDDNAKGIPPDTADKLRKMLAFIDSTQDEEEFRALKTWNAHLLGGDRKGTWSLNVTRNRRLTFSSRGGRARNLRRELRGLSLGKTCP